MNWNSQNSVSSSKPGNKLFPLIAQLVKNLPAMQETPVRFLGWEDPLEKGYPLRYSWASLVAQLVKNPPTMWETWLGKIPGEGKGYPLQYSGLENSMDCRVPVHKELDMIEQLSLSFTSLECVKRHSAARQPQNDRKEG